MPQHSNDETTGWVGWIFFAGVMMVIAGGLNAAYGLVAVLDKNWVGWSHPSHVFFTVSVWGWLQIAAGVLVFLCGFWVFTGNLFARTVGVVLAALSLMANFLFIPVYPFWALTVVVIDALVIWALTAHGHEMKQFSDR
jgi:hypothetical protein